jgi:hypothetical protein
MSEETLKLSFLRNFISDFDIQSNVAGQSMIEPKQVVIDFLIKPKQHLTDRGFDGG